MANTTIKSGGIGFPGLLTIVLLGTGVSTVGAVTSAGLAGSGAAATAGSGVFTALAVTSAVVLKLLGKISISWFWVVAPLLVGPVILVSILASLAVFALIVTLLE